MNPMWLPAGVRQPDAISGTDGILGAAWYQRHHPTSGGFGHLLVVVVDFHPVDAPITTKTTRRNMSHSVIDE